MMSKLKKLVGTKGFLLFLVFGCAAAMIATLAVAFVGVRSFYTSDTTLLMTAKNNIDATVNYDANNIFGKGPQPKDLFYLMSFVRDIEAKNSLTAEFSQDIDLSYSCAVSQVLRIRQQRGSSSTDNPPVYERKTVLKQQDGTVSGSRATLHALDGDTMTIVPHALIAEYQDFLRESYNYMAGEKLNLDQKALGFVGEVALDFTYRIQNAEHGLDRTITRSLVVPLASEVFTIEYTGDPEVTIPVSTREFKQTNVFSANILTVALLVCWFTALVLGIWFGVHHLTMDKNERRYEARKILGRYSDEIIIMEDFIDLSEYRVVRVLQFRELLKLAVNFGKHILCAHDEREMRFAVISDDYAFCFDYNYRIKDDGNPPEGGSPHAEGILGEVEEILDEYLTPTK